MPAPRHDWHTRHWRERYQSERWRRRRRRWLSDYPLCANCHSKGLAVPACIVDHIDDAESKADLVRFLHTDRLQSLCWECHELKHGRRTGGKRIWIGVDGLPVPDPSPFGYRPASTR
jgi:5-methylcytosine-specific restriction endonuclease McrA